VADNFNRANGPLGSSWAGSTGNFAVADNRLDVKGNGAILWNGVAHGVDQEAYVTLTTIDPAAGSISLLLNPSRAQAPRTERPGCSSAPAVRLFRFGRTPPAKDGSNAARASRPRSRTGRCWGRAPPPPDRSRSIETDPCWDLAM
jgi:hypothetical protein